MAMYPVALPFNEDSAEAALDDLQIVRAMDGSAKVYGFYTASKKTFAISHHNLTVASKAILDNFYQANRFLTFSFTWVDGVVYTCAFRVAPQYTPLLLLWNVKLNIEQV